MPVINRSLYPSGCAELAHSNGKYHITVIRFNEQKANTIAAESFETRRAAAAWREQWARPLLTTNGKH